MLFFLYSGIAVMYVQSERITSSYLTIFLMW